MHLSLLPSLCSLPGAFNVPLVPSLIASSALSHVPLAPSHASVLSLFRSVSSAFFCGSFAELFTVVVVGF